MNFDDVGRYLKAGLSVIPIRTDGSKAPAIEWTPFQKRIAGLEELRSFFNGKTHGLAVIGGSISGNLEILDFDEPPLVRPFIDAVKGLGGWDFLKTLPMVVTPDGGLHIYIRCRGGVEGNQKLAERPVVNKDGKPKVKTLIETRGEGGYAILPGGPLSCHSSKKPYKLIRGDIFSIPEIPEDARTMLLSVAKSFDEMPPKQEFHAASVGEKIRPGDEYNATAVWEEILIPHGWGKAYSRGTTSYWRRPGKKAAGISATVGHGGSDLLYIFSSNAYPFEPGKSYSKFAAQALLNFAGDFGAAAKAIGWKRRDNNFGIEVEEQPKEEWPQPLTLDSLIPALPELPLEALPGPLADWAFDVAERMNCPIEFPVTAGLGALSGIVGRRVRIKPKERDDWKVVPNLWAAIIGPPGSMKSPVLSEMAAPISRIEAVYRGEVDKTLNDYRRSLERFNVSRDAWRGKAKKAKSKGIDVDDFDDNPPKEPQEKRLITQDATAEKLHELLAENEAGIIVLKEELVSLMATMQRPERAADRGFLLTGWNGTEPYTIDRIGRGSIYARAVCVVILGGITPTKFRSYLTGDAMKNGGDDGFAARFQLLAYPDLSPAKVVDRFPNESAKQAYSAIFERLEGLNPENPVELSFDNEGQELFNAWLLELETGLRSPQLPDHLKAVKSKQRKLMPALAGLIHLAENPRPSTLGLKDARRAAALCELYWAHALKAYGALGDGGLESAKELLQKIRRGEVANGFSLKSIYDNGWSGLTTAEGVRAAVELLEKGNCVRAYERKTDGRPARVYGINPALWQTGGNE